VGSQQRLRPLPNHAPDFPSFFGRGRETNISYMVGTMLKTLHLSSHLIPIFFITDVEIRSQRSEGTHKADRRFQPYLRVPSTPFFHNQPLS
jgi:hypothetical protein